MAETDPHTSTTSSHNVDESFFMYPHCPCNETEFSSSSSSSYTASLATRMPTSVHRWLNDNDNNDDDTTDNETWEIAYTSVVLFFMFLALISDRVGADSVMATALTAFLVAQIISVDEGLEGFANEGLWTVMVLFVVAEGINKTGALDWYMQKLLGHPTSLASSQLRLMAPIAIVSAFLNNTPVVAVMIPIVQRWAKNIRQSPQQLLIPLSFASILGGTCTLIGTSTNLVVVGLLEDRYQDDDEVSIGLFDLGQYGVPVAMAGIAYILIASPFLLPGGNASSDATTEADELLLGARLTQWSPAVNRTVQRSGLRDTGGIYLVSVHRAATGNVHRAVSKDFVLNIGDILYFTGHGVESFGDFCADNGLEVVTNELPHHDTTTPASPPSPFSPTTGGAVVAAAAGAGTTGEGLLPQEDGDEIMVPPPLPPPPHGSILPPLDESKRSKGESTSLGDFYDHHSSTILNHNTVTDLWQPQPAAAELETILEDDDKIPETVGCSKESLLMADYDELIRNINRMRDIIRNTNATASQRGTHTSDAPPTMTASGTTYVGIPGSKLQWRGGQQGSTPVPPRNHHQLTVDGLRPNDPPKIIVTIEKDLVVVGINAHDRAGLLLDISKGLLRLDLQLHHTEAAVFNERSVSIWRCQVIGTELPDVEEIWSVLNALLSADAGVEAIKTRGLRVIRATVIRGSRLVGKTATEINFRNVYKTAIVALRQGGTNVPPNQLSTSRLDVGDILILQASDDSPLLKQPPANFYKELEEALTRIESQSGSTGGLSRGSSMQGLVKLIRRKSSGNLSASAAPTSDDDEESDPSGPGLSSHNTAPAGTTTVPRSASKDGLDGMVSATPLSIGGEDVLDHEGEIFFVGEDPSEDGESPTSTSTGPGNGEVGPLASPPPPPPSVAEESADAVLHRQVQQDKVWKDLMVMFKDAPSENGTGDGGGGAVASREFLTAMAIAPGSNFAGKTVAQAGIHKLPDLFLVSIERARMDEEEEDTATGHRSTGDSSHSVNRISKLRAHLLMSALRHPHGHHSSPPQRHHHHQHHHAEDNTAVAGSENQSELIAFEAIDPDEPLKEGDVLWFSGSASAVGDLRKIPGLVQYQSEEVEKINERVHDRCLVQAVVARNGPLVGHTVKELSFRTRYGAAVIAVHREGKRVHEHPGRVKLQAGDVLLLEGGPSFLGKSVENVRAFALLAEVKDSAPPRLDLLIPALLIAITMLAVFTAGVTSLLTCALVASVLMVLLGILSEQEARDAVKWDIYITIACAFGIGTALVNSGVAGGIANFLVDVGEAVGIGDAGLLGAVYFATFVISNVVTNNAAAALLFPIAMDAAEQTGTDRVIMSYALMLGASASFMSPFGYTTNLLIYGPGGYKYNDFLRFGTPMQILLWILSTAFLVVELWYISWVAMFFLLVLVSFLRIASRKKAVTSATTTAETGASTTIPMGMATNVSSPASTIHGAPHSSISHRPSNLA